MAADQPPPSPTDTRKLLNNAKANLSAQLAKKKHLDKELMQVEATLYSFETSYLAPPPDNPNGPTYGNIVRGYDSYLKAPNATLGLSERKRVKGNAYALEVRPEERLFSTSSETYQRALDLREINPAMMAQQQQPPPEPQSPSEDEEVPGHKRKRRH